MPRWNRREKPDYRHLRDVTDEAALLGAIRSPTYGARTDYGLLAGFHARLVAMWGDRDVLSIDELVPVHEALRARDPGFFGYGRNWQGPFLHDAVGNLVGWGLRLEVLVEGEFEFGTRRFRMARREPIFERMGSGRWRRIDAVAGRSERGAPQREAYRIRHAEAIAEEVAQQVGVLCFIGAAVPDAWFTRFPDQFARLKGLVERVSDARTTFEQAHRGMHLADQKRWLQTLYYMVRNAKAPERVEPSLPASLPDGDAEALANLQF